MLLANLDKRQPFVCSYALGSLQISEVPFIGPPRLCLPEI
jgi:hypothetical protein